MALEGFIVTLKLSSARILAEGVLQDTTMLLANENSSSESSVFSSWDELT